MAGAFVWLRKEFWEKALELGPRILRSVFVFFLLDCSLSTKKKRHGAETHGSRISLIISCWLVISTNLFLKRRMNGFLGHVMGQAAPDQVKFS